MLSLCFRCLPFSFVLSLVLDVDGGDPLAALLKQLQAVLRSVRHLHWDLICVPGQLDMYFEQKWTCGPHLIPLGSTPYSTESISDASALSRHSLAKITGRRRRIIPSKLFMRLIIFSRDRPSSDAFNARDVVWLVQHVDALPPFSPELPPLRTSVIWSGHSCALLLTYIIVSSR